MGSDSSGYQSNPWTAQLYDQYIPYRERPDVDFFVEEAIESGGPVLEVGCGTGRILIPTARSGIAITGLDLSSSMLDVCRSTLENEPVQVREQVTLVEGDMRTFDLGQKFRLITTPFRPFQHLITVEDQLRCLGSIRRHLAADGIFILDIFNPSLSALTAEDLGQEVDEESEFTTPEGIKVRRFHKVVARDLHHQVQDVELIYYLTYPDGQKERVVHAFPMRYLFRYEAEHLLVRAGFQVLDLYEDYQRTPYGTSYPGELIFRAGLAA